MKTKQPINTLFHSADQKPQHHQSYDLSKWLFWVQRTERSITHIIRSHPKHPAINMLTILCLCLWLNRCQLYVKRYLKSTAQLPVTASLSLPIINFSEHPQLSQLSKHKLYICFKKQPSYCLVCRNCAYHGCLILSTKSELNTCMFNCLVQHHIQVLLLNCSIEEPLYWFHLHKKIQYEKFVDDESVIWCKGILRTCLSMIQSQNTTIGSRLTRALPDKKRNR